MAGQVPSPVLPAFSPSLLLSFLHKKAGTCKSAGAVKAKAKEAQEGGREGEEGESQTLQTSQRHGDRERMACLFHSQGGQVCVGRCGVRQRNHV